MEQINENMFKTADLYLATTLSIKFPIVRIDKENPRKAQFVFNDTEELQDMISKFWKKELRIDPITLFQTMKTTKAYLYG